MLEIDKIYWILCFIEFNIFIYKLILFIKNIKN